MNHLKCECGHINSEGTVLCEACGKPVTGNQHIDGNDKTTLLNMRYDGTARRSQTYKRTMVDKIWNFFSSVKVGVIFIVIALIVSGLGTIFPQEQFIPQEAENRDPAVFYEDWYGLPGKIYYQLGFHELYSSWWYMIIVALIGVSLVICSVDRFVPLYRALKNQQPKRHNDFLSRQRLYSKTATISQEEKETLLKQLKRKRYKSTEKDGNILAEKNRFSRWGPYVNHIGLIIILLATLFRMSSLLFLDDYVWVKEGEQKLIPSTNNTYYIENKQFFVETYDENDETFKAALEKSGEQIDKNYQTNAVIYEVSEQSIAGMEPKLKKVTEDAIRMNKPLKFGGFNGYTLYQSGYREDEFSTMSFELYDQTQEEALGEFTIDLNAPEKKYTLKGDMEIKLAKYYPDYELENGEPRSASNSPRNPAFVFHVLPPEDAQVETSFLSVGQNLDPTGENKYKIKMANAETHYISGLTVRRDYTLPLFIIGAAIFMIGVIQGMYWQHRRIWINPNGEGLVMAAHTNKNWFSLKKDIETIINDTNIVMVVDQVEDKSKEN